MDDDTTQKYTTHMSDSDAKSLDTLVEELWASTEAARAATDEELTADETREAELAALAKEDALFQLAGLLESHPELFEGASQSEMYNRGQEWKRSKEKKVQKLRVDREKVSSRGVRGQPRISKHSKATIEKLLEEGAWPHFVERMSLHHAVKQQKQHRTAAWQDMHEILADTHAHHPEITGKAATLQRNGPAGERLYSLRHKHIKERSYPHGAPSSSWSNAELSTYLRDHPKEVDTIRKCLPGGFLSSASRQLSEQHVQRSGISHWERLTAHPAKGQSQQQQQQHNPAGLNVTPDLDTTCEPVIGKRSRQLAEERLLRTGETDTSLWRRLSKPIPTLQHPPKGNPVPVINHHTATMGNEVLEARVAMDVHERLFKDHEDMARGKEMRRERLAKSQTSLPNERRDQLRKHTQHIVTSGDISTRSREWTANAEKRREQLRDEQRKREDEELLFKPDLKGARSMSVDKKKEKEEQREKDRAATQERRRGASSHRRRNSPSRTTSPQPTPRGNVSFASQNSSIVVGPASATATAPAAMPAASAATSSLSLDTATPTTTPRRSSNGQKKRHPSPPSPAQLRGHKDVSFESGYSDGRYSVGKGSPTRSHSRSRSRSQASERSEMDFPVDTPSDGVLEMSTSGIMSALAKRQDEGRRRRNQEAVHVTYGSPLSPRSPQSAHSRGSQKSITSPRSVQSDGSPRLVVEMHEDFDFTDFVPDVVQNVEREARHSRLDRDNTEQAKDLASSILRQLDEQHGKKLSTPRRSPEQRHTADYYEVDTDVSVGHSVSPSSAAKLRVEQVVRTPKSGAQIHIHQGRSPSPVDMYNSAVAGAQHVEGWAVPRVSHDMVLPSTPMRQVGDSGVLVEGEADGGGEDALEQTVQQHHRHHHQHQQQRSGYATGLEAVGSKSATDRQHIERKRGAEQARQREEGHGVHAQRQHPRHQSPVQTTRPGALKNHTHTSYAAVHHHPEEAHHGLHGAEHTEGPLYTGQAYEPMPPRASDATVYTTQRGAALQKRTNSPSPTRPTRPRSASPPPPQGRDRRQPHAQPGKRSFIPTARPSQPVSLRAGSPSKRRAAAPAARTRHTTHTASANVGADEFLSSPGEHPHASGTLTGTPFSYKTFSSNATPASGSTREYQSTQMASPAWPGEAQGTLLPSPPPPPPRGAHHAVRVQETVAMDENFVDADGMVRLLSMGKQRRLPVASARQQKEQLHKLRTVPRKQAPTTSLDERAVVLPEAASIDDEDAAEISKALLSLPTQEAKGKKAPPRRRELVGLDAVARFLGHDISMSDGEDTSREEILHDGSFESLNEHIHAEVERAVRNTSATGVTLNTGPLRAATTHPHSSSPSRSALEHPEWDASEGLALGEEEQASLIHMLEGDAPKALPRGGRPFVVTGSPPRCR